MKPKSVQAKALLLKYGGSPVRIAEALFQGKLEAVEEQAVDEVLRWHHTEAARFRISHAMKGTLREMEELQLRAASDASEPANDGGVDD